jgi:OTU-like cysteine protease
MPVLIGNCLFRALSDQLYDTTDRHGEIRQKVVEYLRTNRADFEPFVPIDTGDWVRSQASTRSSRSRKVSVDDDHYEAYLENMAKPKTWGGEIEIRAFCEAFDTDVIIHRPTDAGNPFDQMVNNKRVEGQPRQLVHVSFGVSGLCDTLDSIEANFGPGRTQPSTLRIGAANQALGDSSSYSSAGRLHDHQILVPTSG